MAPTVSIVILNYNHPQVIRQCLHTLRCTEDIKYEVVVVDNGSDAETVAFLQGLHSRGSITTLVLNSRNEWFSGGNNIGFRAANPASEYILLLNSDVAILRSDWLEKMLQWMNGVPAHEPSVWGFHPARPSAGPRDIVSIGWSYDEKLPTRTRPEGWCCLFRRSAWVDLNLDFPWHYGFEWAVAESIRRGAKAGVLSQYSDYLVHREGGSEAKKIGDTIVNRGAPDMAAWFAGLNVESLDFTLGPEEHESYLNWEGKQIMHESASKLMQVLLAKYGPLGTAKVLDVGSAVAGVGDSPDFSSGANIVEGTHRGMCPAQWEYTGLDLGAGPNVDVIAHNPYHWPLPDATYDLVISGQCMEHVPELQLWMDEIYRLLVPGGATIIIAPSAGAYHRYPVHCWLIMPDGMEYIMRRAGFDILEIGFMAFGNPFNDCWGVGRKSTDPKYPTAEDVFRILRNKPLLETIGLSWDVYHP